MANRKYLKFGLRADKNLSDLDDATVALDNILDNLSTQLDENGDPLTFSSTDLFPLVGLAQKGLAKNINNQGQPTGLLDLAGSTAQATAVSNTLIDVTPAITIQDYINRFKVILGDPPWIDGGIGPNATIISSDRFRTNVYDQAGETFTLQPGALDITVGNRYRIDNLGNISPTSSSGWNKIAGTTGVTYNVGDMFVPVMTGYVAWGSGSTGGAQVKNTTVPTGLSHPTDAPNALSARHLWVSEDDITTYVPLLENQDFWEDGRFNFSDKIHPDLPDTFGGIRWDAYQSGRFFFDFDTNAYFIIEEDLVDDGTENNWTLVRGVINSDVETYDKVFIETVDGTTRIKFADEMDWRRVMISMKVDLDGQQGEVERWEREWNSTNQEYDHYVFLNIDAAITDTTTGRYIEFTWQPLNGDFVQTGVTYFTPPARGKRRKVRYTAFWPLPDVVNASYGRKRFYDDMPSSRRLSFDVFYQSDGVQDVNGQFTFPYFRDNRAHVLKQDSDKKLVVDGRVSFPYKPPQFTEDIFGYFVPSTSSSTTYPQKSDSRLVRIIESVNSGKLQTSDVNSTKVFDKAETGDWIVVVPTFDTTNRWNSGSSSRAYSFQILEKESDYTAYVDTAYLSTIGLNLDEDHWIQIVKNRGLLGIFKKDDMINGSAGLLSRIFPLDYNQNISSMMKASPNVASQGDLAAYVRFQGALAGTGTAEGSSQEHPLKISIVSEVVTDEEWSFQNISHPQSPNSAFSGLPNNSNNVVLGAGICAVYAGMGLKDLSAASECGGVYGAEVSANSTGNKIYVTALPNNAVNDIVYFAGSDPTNPVIDESTDGLTASGSTEVTGTGTDGTGSYLTISTTLNAEVVAGTTVVLVPNGYSGNKYINREYCVIPLNTAPPFGSTESGLITTTAFKNLIAREIAFDNMHLQVPASDVVSLESAGNLSSVPNRFLAIKYITPEGVTQTWKALINDNLTGV